MLALVTIVLTTAVTIAVAGTTLGFDFLAYHAAAARVLAGQPAYDTSFLGAGGFGLFYYPPTFLPLVLPFGAVAESPAIAAWIVLLLASFAAGVVAIPVSNRTRWLIVLLAGLSWPYLYAIKLGQVGPLLFLLFAVGWRGLERGTVLGITGALGAAIKLQPGIVLGWALLTRRWTALLVGGVAFAALAIVAAVLAGGAAWPDFLLLIGRVSDPVSTPRNLTPGAVAFQLGASRPVASAVQVLAMASVGVAFIVATLRLRPVPSYLVAMLASQLLSPILWDHYAMLLLLPVAWLLDRGRAWAVLIPLATSVLLLGAIPPIVYPAAFGATMVAMFAVPDRPAPSL